MEKILRDLAAQVKRDTVEACAKIAEDTENDRSSADAPFDSGAGACGYSKACFDIAAKLRALTIGMREP